jgi:hypothetical protein
MFKFGKLVITTLIKLHLQVKLKNRENKVKLFLKALPLKAEAKNVNFKLEQKSLMD